MQLIPAKIKLTGDRDTFEVQWSDGHRSAYPYRYLRDKCPCSTCSGSDYHKPSSPSPTGGALPILGPRPLRPERAELVGRYAVQIFWSDNHSSGIYSFPYLRELCPCAECTSRS